MSKGTVYLAVRYGGILDEPRKRLGILCAALWFRKDGSGVVVQGSEPRRQPPKLHDLRGASAPVHGWLLTDGYSRSCT